MEEPGVIVWWLSIFRGGGGGGGLVVWVVRGLIYNIDDSLRCSRQIYVFGLRWYNCIDNMLHSR